MSAFPRLKAAVCITALMSGTAAIADVTAADVWADWQENLEVYGNDGVSIGGETMSGDTLTVTDLTLSMQDEYSSVETNIGTLAFTENGDGTVSVTMPENYPVTMDLEGTEIVLDVFNTGMVLTVSGDPGNMTYDISADTYGIEVKSMEDVEGDMRLTANQIAGRYGTADEGDMRELGYEIAAASMDILVDIQEPGGDGYVVFSGKVDGLETGFGALMPVDVDYEKPEEMFAAGFGMEGGYGYSAANFLFDFNVDGEAAAGSASMGDGGMRMSFDASEISYEAGTENLAVQLQSMELPFPVTVSAAEYGVGFYMPLSKTDDPAEFGTMINLTDFAFNEEIWSMLDPGAMLPHDPATVQLELFGTGKLFFDLLDPEQAAAMEMADIPGELNSLTLENLTLAAAGALVTGAGSFTFDNSDLETFDGLPRPTGEVNVEITGANALIDNLVAMGLLPEEEAMMGRMMMGMFARTVGDDQLTSTLEINEQGHVLANGQRIQ